MHRKLLKFINRKVSKLKEKIDIRAFWFCHRMMNFFISVFISLTTTGYIIKKKKIPKDPLLWLPASISIIQKKKRIFNSACWYVISCSKHPPVCTMILANCFASVIRLSKTARGRVPPANLGRVTYLSTIQSSLNLPITGQMRGPAPSTRKLTRCPLTYYRNKPRPLYTDPPITRWMHS